MTGFEGFLKSLSRPGPRAFSGFDLWRPANPVPKVDHRTISVAPSDQRSSSLAYAPEIVNALRRLICAAARDGMSRGIEHDEQDTVTLELL
jgi:hypothetical protein